MHAIKEILKIEGHTITLKFDGGELRQVDLYDKIQKWGKDAGSKFSELKDVDNFQKVSIEPEFETLVWENGLDLCPDVLYGMSKELPKEQKTI